MTDTAGLDGYFIEDVTVGMSALISKTITEADIVLFGHTHVKYCRGEKPVLFNPGPANNGCYGVIPGVHQTLPVSVYVPGCPVRPEAIIDAVVKLIQSVEGKK